MQKEIMVGQMPIFIRENTDEISGHQYFSEASIQQGNTNLAAIDNILVASQENYSINESGITNPAAADNILGVPRENYYINESDENGNDVNSTGQNSQPESSTRKRKDHYRHTKAQIEAMEEFFKKCPQPNDSQRKELARELDLDPIQVKFWFQNRRTHVKTCNERSNNSKLRAENQKLSAENLSCKHALSNFSCPKCGSSAIIPQFPTAIQKLRLENKRITEEVERAKRLISDHIDSSFLKSYLSSSNANASSSHTIATKSGNSPFGDYNAHLKLFVESNARLVKQAATASMEELIKMIELGEQLWIPNKWGSGYVLNVAEYCKTFPTGFYRNGSTWRNEGSMQFASVMASPIQIVEALTDMTKWVVMYPTLISKATNIYKLSTTTNTKDGDLQVMSVEFQVPCPAIPTREATFMRYCKQLTQQVWVIVDVSLDSVLPMLPSDPSIKCLRWPSGCMIEELPNGFSKVTWVEHVVVNNEAVHKLVEPVLRSCEVYGATRWISNLERQFERIAYTGGIVSGAAGVSSMRVLMLSERMCRQYCGGATSSAMYGWTHISGNGIDDVRIMKKDNINDTKMPFGVVLSASLCVTLSTPPDIVFDYICSTTTRVEWDVFCNGGEIVQETFHVATGQEGNGVSVIQVNGREAGQNIMFIQETSKELTSSSIIYAPLEGDSMVRLSANDTNLEKIGLVPSGFIIAPTKLSGSSYFGGYPEEMSHVGTFLTASFQMMISPHPYENISDESIESGKTIVNNALRIINNAILRRIG